MAREFNDTGLCVPGAHFMADTASNLGSIIALIEKGKYFTINRPRQYGKTTTLFMIERALEKREDYEAINISFESISSESYESIETFTIEFIRELKSYARAVNYRELLELLERIPDMSNFGELGEFISELNAGGKKIVLLIDEVDKSANNRLFLDFLALLRDKYLKRARGRDTTFQSVVLAGVHDIRNLKLKMGAQSDRGPQYNSPWNIAVGFEVDLSLQPDEIAGMLRDFSQERNVALDAAAIAERLFYHTSGYPFLVSRLCKIIDEKMKVGPEWLPEHVDRAATDILKEENTNFESLIKNLENNKELHDQTERMLLGNEEFAANSDVPVVKQGLLYGVFRKGDKLRIHNRIYEQRIYNYMADKLLFARRGGYQEYTFRDQYLNDDGSLNFERLLLKFQEFMKKEYSDKDREFYEREGRLIFLAFLKPILNGYGHDFKEVQVSQEKRLDVVVTFLERKFVVELKIWHGEAAHEKGLDQLREYMDIQSIPAGYLLIFDFNKVRKKKGDSAWIRDKGKEVFAVWV